MHVLIIAQYFPPDFGGASTRAYNIAKALILQGHDVTVITAFPHYPHGRIPYKYRGKIFAKETIEGIKLIRVWIPSLSHSSILKRLVLHFSFIVSCLLFGTHIGKIDVIFAMNPNLFCFFPAWIFGIIHNKKIIRNVDDLWPEVFYELGLVKSPLAKRILDYLSKVSYQNCSAIVPVSQGYVQTIVSKYCISLDKIFVMEHGVDTTIFRYEERAMRDDVKTVMYSGAINQGYDFDIIIEAAKILEGTPIHFVIRGTGDEASTIIKKIEDAGLKNVDIDTKILSKPELISVLNSADIFILPMSTVGTIDQGFPTKILEYQALGKPIICVSNGEAGRFIRETESGIVISSRNPEIVAQSILHLSTDKELAMRLGKNGLDNINLNLTLEKLGKRLDVVIGNIIR